MKYYLSTILFCIGCMQLSAQQPRLKQVDEYLSATGRVLKLKDTPERRYALLQTLYNGQKSLMLNLPDLEDVGAREVMPLGYKLNSASEVSLTKKEGNRCESTVLPLWNKSIFSGVSYQLCDSTVYGITLFFNDSDGLEQSSISKNLLKFFKKEDYKQGNTAVYSDPDYMVKLMPDKLEVYSSFHYPVVESFYPGVSQKIWYAPYRYEMSDASVMLAFYNQESKENNIQSAFRISCRYPSDKLFKMHRIRFILDDTTYEYPIEIEHSAVVEDGKFREECDTRTFAFPEVLKAIERSHTVIVELEGKGGRISYTMPAFQRASIHTAYEYFRWNVTNPMAKYRAW